MWTSASCGNKNFRNGLKIHMTQMPSGPATGLGAFENGVILSGTPSHPPMPPAASSPLFVVCRGLLPVFHKRQDCSPYTVSISGLSIFSPQHFKLFEILVRQALTFLPYDSMTVASFPGSPCFRFLHATWLNST